jgi:hypothetical protein
MTAFTVTVSFHDEDMDDAVVTIEAQTAAEAEDAAFEQFLEDGVSEAVAVEAA